jgi:hypothetical protein
MLDVTHSEMIEVNVAQQVDYGHSHAVLEEHRGDEPRFKVRHLAALPTEYERGAKAHRRTHCGA